MAAEKEFIHELLEPFQYSYKGKPQDAQFITFKAPSSKNLKECSYLKQCFFRAAKENESTVNTVNREEVKEEVEITGETIMMLFNASTTVDLDKVLLTSSSLFVSPGVAMIDGETQLKQTHVENMGLEDLEEVTGKYLANFILASSLKKMNKASSTKSSD